MDYFNFKFVVILELTHSRFGLKLAGAGRQIITYIYIYIYIYIVCSACTKHSRSFIFGNVHCPSLLV